MSGQVGRDGDDISRVEWFSREHLLVVRVEYGARVRGRRSRGNRTPGLTDEVLRRVRIGRSGGKYLS